MCVQGMGEEVETVLAKIKHNVYRLCADQFETSTSPPLGIPRAFDCASFPGRREFERCVGRVGNLNRIYLLF